MITKLVTKLFGIISFQTQTIAMIAEKLIGVGGIALDIMIIIAERNAIVRKMVEEAEEESRN